MRALILLALALALAWAPAQAATVQVTSAKELQAAWIVAKGGDVLALQPGAYAGLDLRAKVFSPRLTIDMQAPGVFVDSLVMKAVGGVDLVGGTYRCAAPCAFGPRVYSGVGVSFSKAVFLGPEVITPGQMGVEAGGTGLVFDAGQDVGVYDSVFSGFKNGIAFAGVTDFKAISNRLTRMGSDGIAATGWGGLIEGNVCDGFSPLAGAHPDCAQLWSPVGVKPTSDIIIRRNVATSSIQCIFLNSPQGFDRILIEDNQATCGHPQGIALYNARDSIVRNNHVAGLPGPDPGGAQRFLTGINIVGGTNVTRCGNTREGALGKLPLIDPPCKAPPTAAEAVEIAALKAKVAAAEAGVSRLEADLAAAKAAGAAGVDAARAVAASLQVAVEAARADAERLRGRLAQISAVAALAP